MGPQEQLKAPEQPAQQSYQSQPVAPQPAPGAAPMPPQPVQPQPKKKLSKGALWGIIGGSIALVLLVVGAILAVVFLGGPTKADYKTALDQAKTVSDQLHSLETDTTPYLIGIGTPAVSGSELQSMLDKYKTAVSTLEGSKALNDSKAKELYNAFKNKNGQLVSLVAAVADSSDILDHLDDDCGAENASQILSSGYGSIASTYKTYLGPCISNLETLAKVSDSTLSRYASQLLSAYKEQEGLIQDLQDAYNAGDSALFGDVSEKLQTQSQDFSTYSSDLKDSIDKIDPTSALDDLTGYLTSKVNTN